MSVLYLWCKTDSSDFVRMCFCSWVSFFADGSFSFIDFLGLGVSSGSFSTILLSVVLHPFNCLSKISRTSSGHIH